MEFSPDWLNNKMTSTDDPVDVYVNITFRSDNYFLIKEFKSLVSVIKFNVLHIFYNNSYSILTVLLIYHFF